MERSEASHRSALTDLDRLVEAAAAAGDRPAEALLDRLPAGDMHRMDHHFRDGVIASVVEAAERLKSAARAERLAAPALATKLERHPESRARMLIDNHARFQTWGLSEELMERSRAATFSAEPARGVRLARLAASVADRIDEGLYGASLTADLRARAWSHLGNAYRFASQLRAAATALRRADDLLLNGTGDPLEQANVLSLRASLAAALGDHPAALQLLDEAEAIYDSLDEDQLLGKVLVQKANSAGFLNPAEGIPYARRSERLLDPAADPRLFLMARHNHILWLLEAGRVDQAQRLLEASRGLYRRFDDPWTGVHLAWTEARLAFAQGDLAEAEASYCVLLDELLDRSFQLDAATCALELAACRLTLGDARGASELAAAMGQHLREWGAHAHARDAWGILQRALSLEKATGELIREISAYLRKAWANPRLAFDARLTGPAGRL